MKQKTKHYVLTSKMTTSKIRQIFDETKIHEENHRLINNSKASSSIIPAAIPHKNDLK